MSDTVITIALGQEVLKVRICQTCHALVEVGQFGGDEHEDWHRETRTNA
jgi:hypothetical protein